MRDWLYKARSDAGFTQSYVAEKLGITESYYCLIENGDRQKKMNISLVSKLSAILDIPIEQIVKNEA